MFTAHAGKFLAGKAAYAAMCFSAAMVLVVSGYAHQVVGLVDQTGQGIAIKGSPSVGAMNILVMGLESRTDYQGNVLSRQLLAAMHAGKYQDIANHTESSQDTNTLILIHIFAGGQKAVGFSIPRDDLVTYPQEYYPGVTQGKIDGAYYFAYAHSLSQTLNTSMSRQQRYLAANKAGQAATIATVESVTGQHIDHFVEVNLVGFYEMARAFHGIEICIKPAPPQGGFGRGANLSDYDRFTHYNNSGFNAYQDGYRRKKGGAQYLHLSAAQSLAYIRARDTLPGVDIGRTHRQQAVLDYVIWKLKHEGAFNDLSTLNALLGTASKYIITDSTFNLLDFATNMRALTGKHMSFTTLPGTPKNGVMLNGSSQDVVLINVPKIQRIVRDAFDPPSAGRKDSTARAASRAAGKAASKAAKKAKPALPASAVTVDVYNGGTTPGLAGQVSQALAALGYKAGAVANAPAQSEPVETGSQVFYGAGAAANAVKIATQFGTTARALKSLPAGHVEVLLGSGVSQVPAGLASPSAPAASPQVAGARLIGAKTSAAGHPASSPSSSPSSGASHAITVSPHAKYGIPCVY